jgi:hypothetical protein
MRGVAIGAAHTISPPILHQGAKPLKIYCDTSVLLHNISCNRDAKSQRELAAVKQLGVKYPMFLSHLVRYEANKTSDEIKRGYLIADVEAHQNVLNDEKLLGVNTLDYGSRGFISYPLISDVQDEQIRAELIDRGLKQRDAEHITQAVCNNCDVFLTRDEKTIIKPHRDWLEEKFPSLKIRLPSELVAELSR